MNYDRVIIELLTRINELEEKVDLLLKEHDANVETETDTVLAEQEKKIEPIVTDLSVGPSNKMYRLYQFLKDSDDDEIRLTYEEIEKMCGCQLPASAYKFVGYWANTERNSHAKCWMRAGYKVVFRDIEKQYIILRKTRYEQSF